MQLNAAKRHAGRYVMAAALLAGSGAAAAQASIQTEEHTIKVTRLLDGLNHPWALAFLPDGRKLVTERRGTLRVVSADWKLQREPVSGLPRVAQHGQGGLMDIALHPRYAETGWIYLSYAAQGEGGVGTEVARGRLNADRLDDVQVLFRMQPKTSGGRHFGSRLVFDRSGFLFITLGDRGEQERAQNMNEHLGKIVRLHDDGRVPADNPFAKQGGARPETFSLGNRNVQGAALHPQTGALWAHEHGPQGGDELNVIRAGRNYGWPVITYGRNYGTGTRIGEGTSRPGIEHPLHHWIPSIAPSGMAFYTGSALPRWQGDLFVGALAGQVLVRLKLDGEKVAKEERLLRGALGRIRDVRVGPDGFIYLLTDSSDGVLARVEPG